MNERIVRGWAGCSLLVLLPACDASDTAAWRHAWNTPILCETIEDGPQTPDCEAIDTDATSTGEGASTGDTETTIVGWTSGDDSAGTWGSASVGSGWTGDSVGTWGSASVGSGWTGDSAGGSDSVGSGGTGDSGDSVGSGWTGDSAGGGTTGDSASGGSDGWTTGSDSATSSDSDTGTTGDAEECTLPDGSKGVESQPNMSLVCWFKTKAEPKGGITSRCAKDGNTWYLLCDLKCSVTEDSPVNDAMHPAKCLADPGTGVPAYISGCEDVKPPQEPQERVYGRSARNYAGPNAMQNEAACKADLMNNAAALCGAEIGDPTERCEAQYGGQPQSSEYSPAEGVCCLKP